MPTLEKMVRSELRQLARERRLMLYAFECFHKQVFPGASPQQIECLRVAFFAGGSELWSVMLAGVDEADAVSSAEEAMVTSIVEELDTFHRRMLATVQAAGPRQ